MTVHLTFLTPAYFDNAFSDLFPKPLSPSSKINCFFLARLSTRPISCKSPIGARARKHSDWDWVGFTCSRQWSASDGSPMTSSPGLGTLETCCGFDKK